MKRWQTWVVLLLLLWGYWAVSLANLTVLPLVYEDEPWQISTGWKIANEGVFGSDMFAGYNRREQHYYGYLPLHPLALAAVFRVAGVGLEQARFETVACGLVILALTFRLAQRLFDARVGLVAVGILLLARGFALTPLHPTGILFLDAVRVARYDVMVPLWGLVVLHLYLTARERGSSGWWYVGVGLACALAGLTHVYGAFFILVVAVLMIWERPRGWMRAFGMMSVGFVVPFLLYGMYVLQDVDAWRNELRGYSDRFGVLDWQWYAENVRTEIQRYSFGLGDGNAAQRPGFWVMAAGLVVGVVGLGAKAVGGETNLRDAGTTEIASLRHPSTALHSAQDVALAMTEARGARVVLVPLVLFPLLFALLIRLKFTNYLFVVVPFAAIVVGWAAIWIWDWAGRARGGVWVKGLVALAAVIVLLEGLVQIGGMEQRVAVTTPYDTFIAQVRAPIPEHTRVAGLQNYGLGWENYDFRSLAIPFLWTNPQLEDKPLTVDEAMTRLAPKYVLLDDRMRAFFREADPSVGREFMTWMDNHGAVEIAQVQDASYGLMQIYRVGE